MDAVKLKKEIGVRFEGQPGKIAGCVRLGSLTAKASFCEIGGYLGALAIGRGPPPLCFSF